MYISLLRKSSKLQIKDIPGRELIPFNLTEEDDSLIINSEEVTKELNNFSSCTVKKNFLFQTLKAMILCQKILIILVWRLLLIEEIIQASLQWDWSIKIGEAFHLVLFRMETSSK